MHSVIFYLLCIFVLGLLVGSFLNVLILRLNTGRSIVFGRSQCFSCNHKLNWYELIPVFSFIFQKGRCRSCSTRISYQYLCVELATAIIFTLVAYRELSFAYFVITAILVAISAYDLRHKIIPDALVYLFIIFSAIIGQGWLTGLAFFAIFALMWLVSQGRWMGFGDAKLVLGIGFLLGWQLGFSALLIAFWTGAIVGVFLLLMRRGSYTIKSEIPFAPFLILGTLVSLLLNIQIF